MNNDTNNNDFDKIPDFFYNITLNYLNILDKHFSMSGYETLLLKRGKDVGADTLVVNFGDESNPMVFSFTFIPIAAEEMGLDTVLLQVYAVLPSKPQMNTMSVLEKSLNFINNQLPVGFLSINNNNDIILRTVQAVSTNSYDLETNIFDKIAELFQITISIYNPHIDDICRGKKTFKQLAFELSNY